MHNLFGIFGSITFLYPNLLYFLFIIPILIAWYIFRYNKTYPKTTISDTSAIKTLGKSVKQKIFPLLYVLRLLAVIFITIALARPQSSSKSSEENIEGIDIVLALDVSGSMLAEDFSPNRLEAAKAVAADFIKARPTDRMGLVVFSGESFTQCPLTIDHRILLKQLDAIRSGMINDGTAIGEGLATAVNRLKNSEAISKTIILLTDGVNNLGVIDPLTAADFAKMFNIRVYTIGVGTEGVAPYPVQTPWGKQYQNVPVQIDENVLTQISNMTDGKYFRATNKKVLQNVFKEIDKLEKTKIEVLSFERKSEEFKIWLWIALALLLIELGLRYTIFRSNP